MGRDANITKRNALVIPGGLLAFYGLLGLVFVKAVRRADGPCQDALKALYHGACYNILWPLVVVLVLGLILVGLGVFLFRGAPEGLAGQLNPGTPTYVVLALLASLVAVPLLAAGILSVAQGSLGTTYVTTVGDLPFKDTFLLEAAAFIGIMMLAPFLFLLLRDSARRRRVLREAEDMAASSRFPGEPKVAPAPAPPEEFVDEGAWPESRQ
jgi:hypothetical protein